MNVCCTGQSDAQAAVTVPQCNRFVLLREPIGARRDAEAVQHQAKDAELGASVLA